MGKDVIIALDFATGNEALGFLETLGDARPFVKVGMELFYAEGAGMLRQLKARGHKIFLDLKLHDIPNTVRSAMRVLAREGVDIINLHAAGTRAMMAAALQGVAEGGALRAEDWLAKGKQPEPAAGKAAPGGVLAEPLRAAGPTDAYLPELPKVIAVTQLTSTSGEQLRDELLIDRPMAEVVAHYAQNAKAAGLAGVVCSPLEVGAVRLAVGLPAYAGKQPTPAAGEGRPGAGAPEPLRAAGGSSMEEFITVTPGIRYADGDMGDQARVTDPAGAKLIGSDYIVVGRPITRAADPAAAYARCMADFTD